MNTTEVLVALKDRLAVAGIPHVGVGNVILATQDIPIERYNHTYIQLSYGGDIQTPQAYGGGAFIRNWNLAVVISRIQTVPQMSSTEQFTRDLIELATSVTQELHLLYDIAVGTDEEEIAQPIQMIGQTQPQVVTHAYRREYKLAQSYSIWNLIAPFSCFEASV